QPALPIAAIFARSLHDALPTSRLSVLAPPVLLHDPPVRKLHPLHQACILKRLRSSTGLAHRDVRPAALRQEAVPRFLICAAPGATCAPVSASAQPVEAFLNLTLGSHTVACVGAIGNVQGAAASPADQHIPRIVRTPAGALRPWFRSLYIIHLIQDAPAARWEFFSPFFPFSLGGNPHVSSPFFPVWSGCTPQATL